MTNAQIIVLATPVFLLLIMVGFVAGLARQTVRHNVTINNILPGAFATDAQRHHVEALALLALPD